MFKENRALKRIYENAPPGLQSLALSCIGLKIRLQRYGKLFRKHTRNLLTNQYNTAAQWERMQYEKLCAIIKYARKEVPYYSFLNDISFKGASVHDVLDRIPILEKKTLRDKYSRLKAKGLKKMKVIELKTSGTTGMPLKTLHDINSHSLYWAAIHRMWIWAGCSYGDRRLSFTGNKIVPLDRKNTSYGRVDKSNNRMFMSSYHLGPETVDRYLEEIIWFKPVFIDGYPSSARYCAARALDRGMDLGIRACFPTAEMLLQHDREIIEKGFGTKVFNQYGSAESAALITECPAGRMHINPEIGIVEVLNEKGKRAAPGEAGIITVTALNNRAMPLIRYSTGDLAEGSPVYRKCECSREMPYVEKVIGRQDESVLTSDGRRIPMLSYNVIKWTDGIIESQIIQNSINDFELKIVPHREKYNPSQADKAVEKLKEYVGPDINVRIEVLDKIPRSSRSKFRAVISRV